MHIPQFFIWTTHTAENTTLLDYKKLYIYMCNIVTEFYLYSIVYIYLINSRLDVTHSVCHHFRTIQTLSWCQRVVGISRNRGNLTAIKSTTTTTMTNRSDTLSWCQRVVGFSRNRENLTTIESTTTTTTMTNRSDTLSWCQTSGKSRKEFTVIELTTHSISRGFSRGLFEYSDFL